MFVVSLKFFPMRLEKDDPLLVKSTYFYVKGLSSLEVS